MGAGGEGSPSPMDQREGGVRMSSTRKYRLEREELLGGGGNTNTRSRSLSPSPPQAILFPAILPPPMASSTTLDNPFSTQGGGGGKASPYYPSSPHLLSPCQTPPSLTPRGMSPLHSPRGGGTISPLPQKGSGVSTPFQLSPHFGPIMDPSELQSAIAKGFQEVVVYPTRRSRTRRNESPDLAVSTRHHRSSSATRRRRNRQPDMALPYEEEEEEQDKEEEKNTIILAPPLLLTDEGSKTTRNSSKSSAKVSAKSSSRSSSRKAKLVAVEDSSLLVPADAMGIQKSSRRSHRQQHKHNQEPPTDPSSFVLMENNININNDNNSNRSSVPVLPQLPAVACFPEKPALQSLDPARNHHPTRRSTRGTRPRPEASSWVQLAASLIMWRDVPRSTLIFGLGCFAIFSASFMQEIQCSVITILAYLCLMYLAAVFVHQSFWRGRTLQSAHQYELSEADALRLVKVFLPAINAFLMKSGELFSGEPAMTLKVAAVLWLLVQIGYFMNLWTLSRLAYFALFIVPKCYSCYEAQFHRYADGLLCWGWSTWNGCSHKKAIMLFTGFMAWNFSSTSACIFGAFMSVVCLRVYHRSHMSAVTSTRGNDTE